MASDAAQAPARPFSRTSREQAGFSEWTAQGSSRAQSAAAAPLTLPNGYTANDWKIIRAHRNWQSHPQDEDYQQAYKSLMQKLAYRHPQTGLPSRREGRGGSGWRHLKENIGYGPGRLLWMDGVVSLYDQTGAPIATQRPVPGRILQAEPRTARSAVYQNEGYGTTVWDVSPPPARPWYTNNTPQPLPDICSHKLAYIDTKYKGFYSMQQQYAA